jgi:UTP:GlnB (protein PII) uridylyltransferase
MNIINNNLNIKEMYHYQTKELTSSEYKKYEKYLDYFFAKSLKKDKYSRQFLDGKYILIDYKNPQKKIIISPSQFVNIHKLYIELKEYSDNLLFHIRTLIESKNNITDNNRKEFDELKEKYLLCKKNINEIDSIHKEFYDEMILLFNNKIEKSNLLAKYYQKRILDYSLIEIMIEEKVKNKLIKIFKENNKKIPSDKEINKIAKENNIASKEIEKWFQWIESSYLYELVKREIVEINKMIEEKDNTYDINTRYMIIKKPMIEE